MRADLLPCPKLWDPPPPPILVGSLQLRWSLGQLGLCSPVYRGERNPTAPNSKLYHWPSRAPFQQRWAGHRKPNSLFPNSHNQGGRVNRKALQRVRCFACISRQLCASSAPFLLQGSVSSQPHNSHSTSPSIFRTGLWGHQTVFYRWGYYRRPKQTLGGSASTLEGVG